MSANIAVINFTAGGTLTVSGKTTLGDQLLSMNSGSFQGLSTTTLATSGAATFSVLPTSTQTPTINAQLTTKVYVDTQITATDLARKLYVDASMGVLNLLIGSTDAARKLYVDASMGVLNTRITSVDAARKTYVDNAIQALTYPGKVVLMKCWSGNVPNPSYVAFNPTVNSGQYSTNWTRIIVKYFQPISSNNFILATFDCNYSVSGNANSGPDTFNARILVNGVPCAFKTVDLGGYRACGSLFPISAYSTTIGASVPANNGLIGVEIQAQQGTADDTLTIDTGNWSLSVSEMTPYDI